MVQKDHHTMKTLLELIPGHVRTLSGYVAGKPVKQAERESGISMIKMASNENPLGPSPLALEAIRAAATELNFYPDNDGTELRWALAARHHLEPGQIFVADGSNALLDIICRTLLGPGLNCVTSERSFISYPIFTRAAQGAFVAVPARNDGYDLDAVLAAINDDTRLVILANPNNPTGSIFYADDTEAFLRRVPDHVLVLLDEAYFEFGEYFASQRAQTYSRSLEYVRAGRPNVVVMRTFSKIYGLAGLRLGYACGHPELLQHFARLRTAFSISALAQAAGLAALHDHEHVRRTLENNDAGAAWLKERFQELGMRIGPVNTNFIYFETDENADELARKMQAEGVIVRSLVPWGIPNGIRVTIGTPEQNEQFMRALKKSLKKLLATSY